MLLYIILCIFANFSITLCSNLSISISSEPIRSVKEQFLSLTCDTHVAIKPDWDGLNFSYVHPLASALAPVYFRIGGTGADRVVFVTNSTNSKLLLDHVNFSSKQLDELYQFVKDSNWRLIFDLNLLLRSNNGSWDPTNAQEFLNYASSKSYVMDFELGNEPEFYPNNADITINGSQVAEDYIKFRNLLNTYPMFENSLLFGPSTSSTGGGMLDSQKQILKDFLGNGGGNAISYLNAHHYYFKGDTNPVEDYLNPDIMDGFGQVVDLLKSFNIVNIPMSVGETSSCYGLEWNNISDSYTAGFLWLDKLGLGALHGLDFVMRQDFFDGKLFHYGLLNSTMGTLPDYWLSFLYKRLIGTQVHNVSIEPGEKNIRLYAASSRNTDSIILYGQNMANSSYTLDIPQFANTQAVLYIFKEGELGNLKSKMSRLNGNLLEWRPHEPIISINGQLSTVPIEVPLYSQFFVVLNQNKAKQCPLGWYQESTFANKCLRYSNVTKLLWFAARLECSTYGPNATLLSIDNVFENIEISGQAQNSGYGLYYLDLYRKTNNTWAWSNRNNGNYRRWKDGYPDDDMTRNCAALEAWTSSWGNVDCDQPNYFICQMYI